jgi:hypothetical protein
MPRNELKKVKRMAVKYKKKKRRLRHFLESTFNLWTRGMTLKELKFFYKEFQYIQEHIDRVNNT